MIMKATKLDEARLLAFANKKPSENLFIIGDIENYGFDSDFQDVYYEEIDGKLEGIYLKYRDNAVIYSENGKMDIDWVLNYIAENNFGHINMLKSTADILDSYLKDQYDLNSCYYCVLDDTSKLYTDPLCCRPDKSDLDQIVAKQSAIEEFTMTPDEVRGAATRRFESGSKQMCLKENGEVMSYAAISIESQTAGMIVSVFTDRIARGKSYATKVVTTLTNELVQEGKSACLFYDNPSAGRIYHAIGFKTIDQWNMYVRKDL